MADQPVPLRRYFAANAVALAPSFIALAALYWSGNLAGRPALIAMAGIAVVTIFLVQRYLGSLARFARFVGELSDEREPVMPRLSFAPATEELATAAARSRPAGAASAPRSTISPPRPRPSSTACPIR